MSIASGNAGAFLPLQVTAPNVYEDIAARYEAQDPATHLPNGTHPTVVARYQAHKKALAAAMRSHGTGFYNHFFQGGQDQFGSLVLNRGTVFIDPADPAFLPPIVDYRSLSNPAELDILVEFLRFNRRYFATPTLAPFQPVEVGASVNATTDEEIRIFIQDTLGPSTFHPVATCPVMPLKLGGVVDQDLLVYGVEKLSIVDGSIIPTIPGVHTQQIVYGIAENVSSTIQGGLN